MSLRGFAAWSACVRWSLATAIVAGALGAAPSSAQVEIGNESFGGQHCPALTSTASGGCFMRFNQEAGETVSMELFGIVLTECSMQLNARIDEDGHGFIYHQELSGPGCVAEPCDTWELYVNELGPASEYVALELCLVVGGSIERCTFAGALSMSGHNSLELTANGSICFESEFMHITGHLLATADPPAGRPEVEVAH
jgi:hypothetical protein